MPDLVLQWSQCPECAKVLETAIGGAFAGTLCQRHPSSKPVRHEREAQRVAGKVVAMRLGKRKP
jgi:hypothetical protein